MHCQRESLARTWVQQLEWNPEGPRLTQLCSNLRGTSVITESSRGQPMKNGYGWPPASRQGGVI